MLYHLLIFLLFSPRLPQAFGEVTPVPPAEIGNWLWVAGGVGGLCLTFVYLRKELLPKEPTPPLHRTFADRSETAHRLQQIELRMEAARLETKSDIAQLQSNLQSGLSELHRRIEDILLAIAKLHTADKS